MNRQEVIFTIRAACERFGKIAEALHGQEYGEGYNRAMKDMIALFESAEAPIDADYAAERESLLYIINNLTTENQRLEREVCDQHAVNQELLKRTNLAEVLGVGSHAKPKGRRGVTFIFK